DKDRSVSPSSSSSGSSSEETSSSSSSSSSEEERKRKSKKKKKKQTKRRKREKQGKRPKLQLFSMEENKNGWDLDEELAQYIEDNTVNYIPDKDILKDVMDKYPVPQNVSEVLKMDLTMDTFLKGKNTPGKITISKDKSLSRISNKVRDILGPLTAVWQQVEQVCSEKSDNHLIDVEELARTFQHSVLLIGQAMNAI
uniref:Uncharacterized protein n=2 Tax=Clytia hemisphaerica TaxID=252671 RepID=A0A7M5WJW3_9CNID